MRLSCAESINWVSFKRGFRFYRVKVWTHSAAFKHKEAKKTNGNIEKQLKC